MNVIGERLAVLTAKDPTKTGLRGLVLLETANTLLLGSGGRTLRIEKAGSAFLLLDSGNVLTGSDIAGRMEDRLGRKKA
ncbi:MAG: ribonuclease P protein subunit [Thaumarchaeota archaeon]|nr:ribonuclease P protein subunit [Nitrososphaerota archaeon]